MSVALFRALVGQHFGLQLDDDKLPLLAEVLERRAQANRLDSATYLASLAVPSAPELGALAEELTVGETYFFRNADQFEAFTRVVIPARIAARSAQRTINVLSAACASGEEPYSLAIALRGAVDPSWTISIRGVDVNPAAIRRATAARYTTWSLRETPSELQHAWFRADGRELVLDPRIRSAVRFELRNLTVDDAELWAPETYDAIFCRNVLMYFTPAVAQQVVARIHRALVPGGYLFLGHAETLRGLSQAFRLCHSHDTFYYQRRDRAERPDTIAPRSITLPITLPISVAPAAADAAWLAEPATPVELAPDGWIDAIHRATERIRRLVEVTPERGSGADVTSRPAIARVLELLREERFAEAGTQLDALPPELAREPALLLVRAVALTHGGKFAEAEAVCQRLLAIDELDAGAHYVIALCREGAGDRAGAIDHDQTAAYLDPMFAMPRLHRGLIARRDGDRETARRELDQALLLLQREDPARVLLFGGGFQREALIALCRAELASAGGPT